MILSHVDTSMTTLHESHWKTPNLEDLYLDFCNSVWPHLYTVGNIFQLAKTFQKTPKSKNAQKCLKNEFFLYTWLSLKETRVWHTTCQLYNPRVLLYVTFCTRNMRVFFVYATMVFSNPRMPLKTVKKHAFWNSGSLGSYATDSFSCNYFVFAPNSSLSI